MSGIKGFGENYKSKYEKNLAIALRAVGISYTYESLVITLDAMQRMNFRPDFVTQLQKDQKQVVIEIHSSYLFNIEFIEKMFFAKRLAPNYYYVVISDEPKEKINAKLNSHESGLGKIETDKKGRISTDSFRNFFGGDEQMSEFDYIYSELGFKAARKSLDVKDICDEFWSFPNLNTFKEDMYRAVDFYTTMQKVLRSNLDEFKSSLRQ